MKSDEESSSFNADQQLDLKGLNQKAGIAENNSVQNISSDGEESGLNRFLQALKTQASNTDYENDVKPTISLSPEALQSKNNLIKLEQRKIQPVLTLKVNEQQYETTPAKLSHSWCWNEEFTFHLREFSQNDESEGNRLDIVCRNSSPHKDELELIGYVSIPLGRLPNEEGRIEQWYELLSPETASNERSTGGVILLAFEFVAKLTYRTQSLPNVKDNIINTSPCDPKGTSQRRASDRGNLYKLNLDNRIKTEFLPTRLADYFLIISRKSYISSSDISPEPTLRFRFPKEDHDDLGLPTKIEWFCNADDANVEDIHEGKFYTFVHAPRGIRLYGYCFMFHEEAAGADTCLCFVSRLGLGQVFEECLRRVYELVKATNNESDVEELYRSAARRLITEVPLPAPGLLRILFKFDLIDPRSNNYYSCVLNKFGGYPSFTFEKGLLVALKLFGISRLIDVWAAALLECKILFHSSKVELLALISESILCLLYPFRWLHTYIPLLPREILECVQAPLPYIIGISTKNLELVSSQDLREVVLIDLNTGSVDYGPDLSIPALPVREHRRLFRMLQTLLGTMDSVGLDDEWCASGETLPDFEVEKVGATDSCRIYGFNSMIQSLSRKIQMCFLECFASMMYGYQDCLFLLNKRLPVFNQPQFLEMRGQDSLFFIKLLETQAFELFKETQQSQWLQLFHCCYFQICERIRDREQLIALSNQKVKGLIRQNLVQQRHASIVDALEQNPCIWASRSRRSPRKKMDSGQRSGLEIIELQEQDKTLENQWIATWIVEEKVSEKNYSLKEICEKSDLDLDELSSSLEDLDRMLGTYRFTVKESQKNDLYDENQFSGDKDSLADEEEYSRSVSLRKNYHLSKKGAEFAEVENILQEVVTSIFLNKGIDENQIQQCRRCFATSQHSRDVFVLILYQPRANRAASRHLQEKHSSRLEKRKGSLFSMTGRGLRKAAFDGLVNLSRTLLEACNIHEDYNNGRQMLELSRSYYEEDSNLHRAPDYGDLENLAPGLTYTRRRSSAVGAFLETRLKGLELWQSLLFWEQAFSDTLTFESRKRSRTLSNPLHSYNLAATSCDRETEEEQDTLFQLATNMVYTMIRLEVAPDKAKALVSRISSEHGLKEEYEETLYTLISNISRAGDIAS